ncbi:MAG: DUF3817 domain-containing protein [Cyclobacteriaceae bacterium]|nr:DUF3817 domain-containing protein [Cyclobacteriaceae bacterium]
MFLLLIAMPLKYYFDLPMAVKVTGWIHGVLFMLYIAAVLFAIKAMAWNWFSVLVALAASIPLITLNTTSSVKPTIRKGKRINHTNGKSTSMIKAIGQQITKRINQSTSPIKVLIAVILNAIQQSAGQI